MKRLVISDLHFGASTAVGAHPLAIERITPEMLWADEIIVLGDLFSLNDQSWEQIKVVAKPFTDVLARAGKPVVFVPGNHDYHFIVMAQDAKRFGSLPQDADPAYYGAQLLEEITDCPVKPAYPFYKADGITYTHGHHTAGHVLETGIARLDSTHLDAYRAGRPAFSLAPDDYEALMTPIHEMMYQVSRSPSTKMTQPYLTRMRAWTLAAMYASLSEKHMLAAGIGRRMQRRLGWKFPLKDQETVLALLAAVCTDFDIDDGDVVSGHTHQEYSHVTLPHYPRWRFHNSGCWVYNKAFVDMYGAENVTRPGSVLRIEDGDIQLKNVLEDLTGKQLLSMLP